MSDERTEVKLICFDLNHTLIEENSWLDLNLAMGVRQEEDEMLMNWGKEGVISYTEGQQILEEIYKKRGKATIENIEEAISDYTYKPGARDVINYLKEQGYTVALISGSMDILVEMVARDLEIEFFEANNLFIFNEDDYLEKIISLGHDEIIKLRHLEKFCRSLDIALTECFCVADGANDILMFKKTGHGITFEDADANVKQHAWKTIDILADLKEIF